VLTDAGVDQYRLASKTHQMALDCQKNLAGCGIEVPSGQDRCGRIDLCHGRVGK